MLSNNNLSNSFTTLPTNVYNNRPYALAYSLVESYAECNSDGHYTIAYKDLDRDDLYDLAASIYVRDKAILSEALGADNDLFADIQSYAVDMLVCAPRANEKLFKEALLAYVKERVLILLADALDDYNFDQTAYDIGE